VAERDYSCTEEHGGESTFKIEETGLTEREVISRANDEGVGCEWCSRERIQHTDRREGRVYFCCGSVHEADEDHLRCPTCALCESCGGEADQVKDGMYWCEGCVDDEAEAEDEVDEVPVVKASEAEATLDPDRSLREQLKELAARQPQKKSGR
jgi:hypothetical protein